MQFYDGVAESSHKTSCANNLRYRNNVQVRAIIVETSGPAFHVYGGCCPLGVPSDRKCIPSAEKFPLGLYKRYRTLGANLTKGPVFSSVRRI